ncbi:MAG: Type II secretion system protein D [Nitrospira sp.]|nr:Type II secretion system protein D [Nitrospira sp.]
MQNNKTQNTSKIPVLGDIPLLGLAFQRKTKANTKTELLIFLTPYIVKEPSQLAAFAEREKQAIQLAPKAFTEKELDAFVEGIPVKKPEATSKGKRPVRPKDKK